MLAASAGLGNAISPALRPPLSPRGAVGVGRGMPVIAVPVESVPHHLGHDVHHLAARGSDEGAWERFGVTDERQAGAISGTMDENETMDGRGWMGAGRVLQGYEQEDDSSQDQNMRDALDALQRLANPP